MTFFATEFPIKGLPSAGSFVAEIVAWLRGTTYSTVLDDVGESDLDGVAPVIRANSGEELRLRVLRDAEAERAIGFRHDFPDGEGRLWRTEAVLRRGAAANGQDLIRLRTQCVARVPGARLDTPRKPYLLKSLLAERRGGVDGNLEVSDQAIWLADDETGLATARSVIAGEASRRLPIVYISGVGRSRWALSKDQIARLAYDLGGVAHVIAEPDRSFSFRLKDSTDSRNVYGGTIGLALPDRGIVRRYFLGGRLADPRTLQSTLRDVACTLRSQMPAEGWDWTELQEQSLRQQRERERNWLSTAETEALYEEEIANLKDQVGQLKGQLSPSDLSGGGDSDEGLLPTSIAAQIGPELYPGELVDRLRVAAKAALQHADQDGLDARTKVILQRFVEVPSSTGLAELIEDLKRATKDPRRMAAQLGELLSRHGYNEKPRNKHVVLEPRTGFSGLENITVPTTPSDNRGLTNMRKQVERTLGLSKLAD